MPIPKKLVDYKFSYPKRKLNKNTQEARKENEVIQEYQKIKPDIYQTNQNIDMNHQEEDFWVDCKKYISFI